MGVLTRKMLSVWVRMLHRLTAKRMRMRPSIPGFRDEIEILFHPWPYPHAVIDNVLSSTHAEAISAYIEQMLFDKATHFEHHKIYDIYTKSINEQGLSQVVDFGYSNAFRDFVGTLFEHALSQYTLVTIHNNTPRKEDKYIHTDAVPVVFRTQSKDTMHSPGLVKGGVGHFLSLNKEPIPDGFTVLMRSATSIIYLSKDWKKGCGGETGIYYRYKNMDIECAKIEPLFNRMLLMRNTGNAHHNYHACSLQNRNSLIQWFHT